MKKIFTTYFTLIICLCLTILFTTCKKYPDGGYTKRAPKNVIGEWTLSLYEVNGIDSTDLINYNGNDDYKNINFLKNGGSSISIQQPGFGSYPITFFDSNKKIEFSNSSITSGISCIYYQNKNYCHRSCFIPEPINSIHSTDWSIVKLTKKEIVIKSEGKNSYLIKLSK